MDRHRWMLDFVRIVDACGIAEGRFGVDVVPAAAVCTLSDLEFQLGIPLVQRGTRRLSLTSDGRHLLALARPGFTDSSQTLELAANTRRDLQGIVRLGAPARFAIHQLAKHLPRFHALWPSITVDVCTDSVDDTHDLTIEIGRRPPQGDYTVHQLAYSEVVMCASPDYLDRHGRPSHPKELVEHSLLLPQAGPERQEQLALRRNAPAEGPLAQEVWRFQPKANTPLSSQNADLIYAGALAGLGLCSLPSYVIEDALLESALERVLPEWSLTGLSISLCMPSHQVASPCTKSLMEFLFAVFGASSNDPWLKFAGYETRCGESLRS